MSARAIMDKAPVSGFFGKLPSRGDFVGRGLSSASISVWDDWISQSLVSSRALLAEGWVDAWMVAPVWHFALPAGQCGPVSLTGLLCPSMDRVGRYFPIIAATELPRARQSTEPNGEAYHDALEQAVRDALMHDLAPEALSARLAAIPAPDEAPPAVGLWWTDGGENVAPTAFECAELPDVAQFLRMLHD
jgi:type VI secretion system protein ImpM